MFRLLFLQNADMAMTTEGERQGNLNIDHAAEFPARRCLTRDRELHALRHREGLGKNWRSYRRGYERRFIDEAGSNLE
jgi:hypothetical protein